MKKHIYTRFLAALAVGTMLVACGQKGDPAARLKELKDQRAAISQEIAALEKEVAKNSPDSAKKAKEVVVTDITPVKSFDHFIQTQGSVEAEENVQLSAKSAGVVTAVLVREGEMVSKGQVIAQIDNSLVMRGIDELKSQLELATTVYERQKNLWDQKIGTEVQYLQAKTNKESMERRIASLNEQNEMTKIKSPITGVIDAIDVKVGQNIAPGMPAARVVNNSDLKISVRISEAYSNQLKRGAKIQVSFPDLNKTINSSLSFVARNIDPLSRTFLVEADLPSSADLRPNMTAIVRVVFDSTPNALVVPVNVVQTINDEKVVFIAEPSGKYYVAKKKIVTVDGVFDNLAEVKGLAAGDKLITVGYQGLNDGEFVKI